MALLPGASPGTRLIFALGVAGLLLAGGCFSENTRKTEKVQLAPRYPTRPPKPNLPAFMKGTIHEITDIENNTPYLVSGYGLVVGLNNTGDNNGVPMAVRNYMYDQMVQHGFGEGMDDAMRQLKPARVLADPRTSIVEVYGFLPPGARAGQRMDIFTQAVITSRTKSLAGGMLYMTDLRERGVDPIYPRGGINVYAKARGPIFVTPTYVAATTTRPGDRSNLRSGIIMNGGMVMNDRNLTLRLRQPQLSLALAVQDRIRYHYQDDAIAKAQDEGTVYVLVPPKYRGDWKRFLGVVSHLYIRISPGSGTIAARELAKEATKPGAPLQDISYCWEGLGEEALPSIQSLYGHPSSEVAFAAARAGAFIGDITAVDALAATARTDGHPFALAAIKTLGSLPESPRITRALMEVLSSSNALTRAEAYLILADQRAPVVLSREIRGRFIIDRVICDGPPMIYATRTGTPRIAIFGQNLPIKTPIMFSAIDDQLTITSTEDHRALVVFDRTSGAPQGASAKMSPDLYDLLRRLGGDSNDGFAFAYSDLVGILQALVDRRCVAASFVLQEPPNLQEAIEEAPPIPELPTPSTRPAQP